MSVVLRCAGDVPLDAPPVTQEETLAFAERFLIWAWRRHALEQAEPGLARLLPDAFRAASLTRAWTAFDACGSLLAAARPCHLDLMQHRAGSLPDRKERALLQATALLQAGAPAPAAHALHGAFAPALARLLADPLGAFARIYADSGYVLPIRLELMQTPCAVH